MAPLRVLRPSHHRKRPATLPNGRRRVRGVATVSQPMVSAMCALLPSHSTSACDSHWTVRNSVEMLCSGGIGRYWTVLDGINCTFHLICTFNVLHICPYLSICVHMCPYLSLRLSTFEQLRQNQTCTALDDIDWSLPRSFVGMSIHSKRIFATGTPGGNHARPSHLLG